MSACPDNNSGYLDGEDEVSDQKPHELTTDHGVTENPKEVHEEENSIDGIPTNLKNVWESGKLNFSSSKNPNAYPRFYEAAFLFKGVADAGF